MPRVRLTLGHCTLQAGVKDISRKERQCFWLVLVLLAFLILAAHFDEPWQTTDRLSTRRVQVVDVIVVNQSQIWR